MSSPRMRWAMVSLLVPVEEPALVLRQPLGTPLVERHDHVDGLVDVAGDAGGADMERAGAVAEGAHRILRLRVDGVDGHAERREDARELRGGDRHERERLQERQRRSELLQEGGIGERGLRDAARLGHDERVHDELLRVVGVDVDARVRVRVDGELVTERREGGVRDAGHHEELVERVERGVLRLVSIRQAVVQRVLVAEAVLERLRRVGGEDRARLVLVLPVLEGAEQVLARDAQAVRVILVEEEVPPRVLDELREPQRLRRRQRADPVELPDVDLALLVLDRGVERALDVGEHAPRALLRRGAVGGGGGRRRLRARPAAAQEERGCGGVDGHEVPEPERDLRRGARARRAATERGGRGVRHRVEPLLEVEDEPRHGDGAPREVGGAQLVARVRRHLEGDARVVGEVDRDRGEDRDRGDRDEQRRAALALSPPPRVSGACHGQKLSGRMMATRACVSNARSLPSGILRPRRTFTRVGSTFACSALLVTHSRAQSWRFQSQYWPSKVATCSQTTSFAPPRSGSSSMCAFSRRKSTLSPGRAGSGSTVYSTSDWSDSLASWTRRAWLIVVKRRSSRSPPSLPRKTVSGSRKRLWS